MLSYRADIDGLRAVAVLSVILFHAGFNIFGGGYVGVDIFFVLSGFLITNIILAEVSLEKFSILNFYERRARRILPALYFMMLFFIPVAWILLAPKDIVSFFRSIYSIPTFTANIFFWKDVDYFATAAELKPLIHTWSLSVEEQFYVLFPMLFLVIKRRHNKNILLFIISILTLSSLFYSQLMSSKNPSENFFLLPTRFWEIALGGIAAFIYPNINMIKKKSFELLGILGAIMILLSIFYFDKNTPVPGFFALIPTIGTVLIILFSKSDTIIGKLLSNKILVKVGLLSYSAYLWHQPIFAFYRYRTGTGIIDPRSAFILILVSLTCSWISWKLIETPFRNKNRYNRKFIFKYSVFFSLLFVALGAVIACIFMQYDSDEKAAKVLVNSPAVYFNGINNEAKFMENLVNAQTSSPDVVVIGSSRIMQIRSLNEKRLLNLGVSGSSLVDDIGMIYLVKNKLRPSTILIGADPWLLSSQTRDGRYGNLEKIYENSNLPDIQESVELPKVSKFKSFILDVYDRTTLSMRVPRDDSSEVIAKKRNDGSHVYDSIYSNKSQVEIEQGLDNGLNYKTVVNFDSETEVVARNAAMLEFTKLLQKLKQESDVVLVLSPYHPKLYSRMKIEKPYVLVIEKTFREIAKSSGVKIIGSYDPSINQCSEDDFYDGMHPKDDCMARIFSTYSH